jgi:serine beta-lactamase-like protein LACTB, mitochondrial
MKSWLGYLAMGLLLISSATSWAQTAKRNQKSLPKAVVGRIDDSVKEQMSQQQLVGVSIGVIDGGRVAYSQGFGFADVENQVAMTPQSLIRWASVSKPLTAVVAGQLVAEGRLSFDDDVRKYVPEFPDHGVTIRVRDLLCHQSGIVHYANGRVVRTQKEYGEPHPFQNVINSLDTFKESPLVNAPGEKYSYSTHAYMLLSAVTERAENKPFAQQVQDRINSPLGLTTLQPDYQWVEISPRAVGYRLRNQQVIPSTNTDVSWKLGGGGFISSVEDMAAFGAGLMGSKLLSEKIKSQMWVRQKTTDGSETDVGLGFFIDGVGESLRVSHNGSQEKAKTRMVIYPNRKNGIVVMSNCEHAEPGRISTAIYQAWNAK